MGLRDETMRPERRIRPRITINAWRNNGPVRIMAIFGHAALTEFFK